MNIATSLATQSTNYELEISDRLYAYEMLRLSQDHDRLLTFIYPKIYTLIPREILREQLAMTSVEAVFPSRLNAFELSQISEPLDYEGQSFVSVSYHYTPAFTTEPPRLLRTTIGSLNQRDQKIERSLLAIRTDHDLQWYFLELANGQQALLSSIIPEAALRLK